MRIDPERGEAAAKLRAILARSSAADREMGEALEAKPAQERAQFYRKRAEWFALMEKQHLVMWWVGEGHRPTLEEARARLDHLDRHGDSDFAFGWSHLPHVRLWQQARCT